MISRFQIVALSAEEKNAWEFEQLRASRALSIELNPRAVLDFTMFLAAVTMLVVSASLTLSDSTGLLPAWMQFNALPFGDLFQSLAH